MRWARPATRAGYAFYSAHPSPPGTAQSPRQLITEANCSMGALFVHGRPKKELGAHGEKGFHGRSSEYSELIIGEVRISRLALARKIICLPRNSELLRNSGIN
jgi:hypothetical protein